MKAHFVVTIKNTMLEAFTVKQGLKAESCWSQLIPAHKKGNSLNFFSTLKPPWEYLHQGNWQKLQIRMRFSPSCFLFSLRIYLPTYPYLEEQI